MSKNETLCNNLINKFYEVVRQDAAEYATHVIDSLEWNHDKIFESFVSIDYMGYEYSAQVTAVTDGVALVEVFYDEDDFTSTPLLQFEINASVYPQLYTIDDNDERFTNNYQEFFEWLMETPENNVKKVIAVHYVTIVLCEKLFNQNIVQNPIFGALSMVDSLSDTRTGVE